MRIHRAVGWATTHADSAGLAERLYESGVDGEVEEFVASLVAAGHKGMWLHLPREGHSYPLRFRELAHQVCGPDFRENDWIVATPPFALKWFRKDDMLDWAAVRHSPGWEENRIVELPEQPYPYNMGDGGVPEIIRLLARELGFDEGRLVPSVATWWC